MTGTVQHGVTLVGERVRLREFRLDDLDDSDAVLGDDRVIRWLSFDSRTREQQAAVLTGAIERAQQTPRAECYFAITTHADDRLIGFVRLGLCPACRPPNSVLRSRRRTGPRPRPRRHSHHHRLRIHHTRAAPHLRSHRARQRRIHRPRLPLGFTEEGRLRDHVFTNGAWRDSTLYSLLAHEWLQDGR